MVFFMYDNVNDMLIQIPKIIPANEAEVETKILLHIFRFLNYTDIDRTDKPHIAMQFGREEKVKIPDFIFYDGNERTISKALISVEAKKIGESLIGAEQQVKSYATFAGTPYYVVCNGEEFIASRFTPGANIINTVSFYIKDIAIHWEDLRNFIQRAEVLLCKERLQYQASDVPYFEELPASEFYKRYLNQLHYRFSNFNTLISPLEPPSNNKLTLPTIPISVNISNLSACSSEKDIADFLIQTKNHILIEGSAGSGKTTLCYRIVSHLSSLAQIRGANILPIYVRLIEGVPTNTLEALKKACKEINVPVYSALFEKSILHNHVILILDGLDELLMNNKDSEIRRFSNFISGNLEDSILITTRPLINNFGQLLNTSNTIVGKINYLTNSEVYRVLDEYIIRENLSKFIKTNKLTINSPLILYMLIRVTERIENVQDLSKFGIYTEYVKTLHEYFNCSSVRGSERFIPLEEVLSILSFASNLIANKREKQVRVSLNELKNTLELTFKTDAIIALINIGLITSISDKAEFIHYSFEEFGIAYRIVNCIKTKDIIGFADSTISSEGCYSMIFAELSETDRNELVVFLNNSKNKIRKRAMGILKYSENKVILEAIGKTLAKGNTTTVSISIVQMLVDKRDEVTICWLLETDKIKMSDKIDIFNNSIQSGYAKEYMEVILNYPNPLDDRRISIIITKLYMRNTNRNEITKIFKSYYWKQTENVRLTICSIIRKKPNNILLYELVSEILEREDSVRIIIRLLPFIIYISFNDIVLNLIKSSLSLSKDFKSKDVKYINEFIMLAEDNCLEPNIVDIYDICKIIKPNPYYE